MSRVSSKAPAENLIRPPVFIPLKEACRRYGGIHRTTAYRRAREGKFPAIRVPMGRAVVLESELEDFMQKARVSAQKMGQ
jgi:predicted site-specific integrase-resolvase